MKIKVLVTGDCIINQLDIATDDMDVTYIHYSNYNTSNIHQYDSIIAHVSYSNQFSVIESPEKQYTQYKKYNRIVDSLNKNNSKNILVLDRPGTLTRYISKEYRHTIDKHPTELGMCIKSAYECGWEPQEIEKQFIRRATWRNKLLDSLNSNITYYDLNQYISHEHATLWSGELNHKSRIVRVPGGVVGEAPWHYREPYTVAVTKIIRYYLSKLQLDGNTLYTLLNS